jgi:hypothetical protein
MFPFRQRCDGFPQPVIRGKHPVAAVPVFSRRRHKVRHTIKELTRRQLDHVVVVRIPAFPQSGRHDHFFGIANGCGKKLQSLLLAPIPGDLRPSQPIVQFLERRFGNQQLTSFPRPFKRSPGRRAGEHERADDDIRVDYESHVTARRESP